MKKMPELNYMFL